MAQQKAPNPVTPVLEESKSGHGHIKKRNYSRRDPLMGENSLGAETDPSSPIYP